MINLEKTIEILLKHGIEEVLGPNVSIFIKRHKKEIEIISPRGRITYNPELLDDELYREELEYVFTGKKGPVLKEISDGNICINSANYISKYCKKKYNVKWVGGEKRKIPLVKIENSAYVAVRGNYRITYYTDRVKKPLYLSNIKDEYIVETFWDTPEENRILSTLNEGEIAKYNIPFINPNYVKQHVKIFTYMYHDHIIVYDTPQKYVRTKYFAEKDRVYFEEIAYIEGIYEIEVPKNYNGPDPLSVTSIKDLPKEVTYRKFIDVNLEPNLLENVKFGNDRETFIILINDYIIIPKENEFVIITPKGKRTTVERAIGEYIIKEAKKTPDILFAVTEL